ncbi:MAG: sugar ABC transporter ATPase [Microbacteriaceae bacterium]|uniref:sugar ABC transporter ATPase n=1 Tax=Microbacterium sp. TaxID=51671 RepID=UPI003F961986
MESTSGAISDAGDDEEMQPLRDGDATTTDDANDDAAQAEWDRTRVAEAGDGTVPATATGRDPDEIPDPEDEVPFEDLPAPGAEPDTQGDEPVDAELGEEGQGDLAPEDL